MEWQGRGSIARDSQRLEKQRARQRALRQRNRDLKQPGRDDFARMLLHVALEENVSAKNFGELDRLQDGLVKKLVHQGFDEYQCEQVFEELIEKYERGWTFFRKIHLLDTSEE